MKKIIVGSHNPVKLETTKEAFGIVFAGIPLEFETCNVPSGVSDQPIGADETRIGAKNRTDACKKEYPQADFFVGLEGGLEKVGDEYWAFAWMCVQNNDGRCGFGRTGAFLLPSKVSELIDRGMELGSATDIVFGGTNMKQKGGTIGALTNDAITRKDFYRDALIFALIPFIKAELY